MSMRGKWSRRIRQKDKYSLCVEDNGSEEQVEKEECASTLFTGRGKVVTKLLRAKITGGS